MSEAVERLSDFSSIYSEKLSFWLTFTFKKKAHFCVDYFTSFNLIRCHADRWTTVKIKTKHCQGNDNGPCHTFSVFKIIF
jgi:hypothetical protein